MGMRMTVAEHRRRWGMWTAGVVCVAAAATTAMALARVGRIDPAPWGYALAVAALSALTGLFLAYAMAVIESKGE